MPADTKNARCPICGLVVPIEEAPRGARTGIVCPNCGTPFSHKDQYIELLAETVTLFLDHYEIRGTVYLSSEYTRFSDAWEALIAGSRTFIPITDVEVRRQGADIVARSKFMQVQKSEIRGAVPSSEEL
jgi:endogenous inhibitor of DNA gyrase (YacG/DUF329 family)